MSISTTHNLGVRSWTVEVEILKTAIKRFASRHLMTNECRIALFEVPGDANLHVNVTHRHQTKPASGWVGPAAVPQGFVHNRCFGAIRPNEIVRHISEMVFSERI